MKTKLLHYLESRRGEFVSGESLADMFGVTIDELLAIRRDEDTAVA